MKNNEEEKISTVKKALRDTDCSFFRDGQCCPIQVSGQFESRWYCSRHFKYAIRGNEKEAIDFFYEVMSNPRKFTHPEPEEHWFEAELRSYTADPVAWAAKMPKPKNLREADVGTPMGDILAKKMEDFFSAPKLPHFDAQEEDLGW